MASPSSSSNVRLDDDPLAAALRLHEDEATTLKNSMTAWQQAEVAGSDTANLDDEVVLATYKYRLLKHSIFVGHTNTDTDSVAAAIGGAVLFLGKPARASDLNDETAFVMSKFPSIPVPPLFADLATATDTVTLVDHNQITQVAAGVQLDRIVGIIDHHAVQSSPVVTPSPVLVDIRPWGSACTIIARMFVKHQRALPVDVAGLLLCGILSDTLNLRSPTTTRVDRVMAVWLAKLYFTPSVVDTGAGAAVELGIQQALDELASAMFQAKSSKVMLMSPHALVMGDHKVFSIGRSQTAETGQEQRSYRIGFGVIETVDPTAALTRVSDIVFELQAVRKELSLDFSFFAVVDTLNLTSSLIICGECERLLAQQAFTTAEFSDSGFVASLAAQPGLVSRKKNFVPMITSAIEAGISLADVLKHQKDEQDSIEYGDVVAHRPIDTDRPHDHDTVAADGVGDAWPSHGLHHGCGCEPRRSPVHFSTVAKALEAVQRFRNIATDLVRHTTL